MRRNTSARIWIIMAIVLVAGWVVTQIVNEGSQQRRVEHAQQSGERRAPLPSAADASRDVRADEAIGSFPLPALSSSDLVRRSRPAPIITDRRIVIVPVADVTRDEAQLAARLIAPLIRIPVTVAAPTPLRSRMVVSQRRQLDADSIIADVRRLHPMTRSSTALIVALAPGDLVSRSTSWDALYSYRLPVTGYTAINLPRLGFSVSGGPLAPRMQAAASHRLQVQLARLIGIVQLGIAPDARTDLFGPVLDLQDMDVRKPDLCASRHVAHTLRATDLRCG